MEEDDFELEQQTEEFFQCHFCNNDIDEDTPITELLCHHMVHTQCIFVWFQAHREYTCQICNPPEPAEGEAEGAQQQGPDPPRINHTQIIQNLYDSHPEYKQDIKAYVKTQTEIVKAHKALTRVIREKKEPVRAEFHLLQHQMNDIIRRTKQAIQSTPEHRKLLSLRARMTRLETKIEREFDYEFFEIRRALKAKKGLKRIKSRFRFYWYSPGRALRRAMYIRTRF